MPSRRRGSGGKIKTVAIIQARTGSTRLPGKVLLPLAGKSMLQNIIERVKRAKRVDEVVLAVPRGEYNAFRDFHEIVQTWAPNCEEPDLIGRFYDVAALEDADLIVRICSDNPLIEPAEIDRAIEYWMKMPSVFVSNMHNHASCQNQYPDGIGCEVFSFNRLQWMNEHLTDPHYREHPHKIFHDLEVINSPLCPSEFARPDLKLDINTRKEYEYIKDIYDHFGHNNFHITEVIKYLDGKK